MSDEVRVLVGTIAFGLGINKAAVRAVIHLSLPKSIEQYLPGGGARGTRRASRGLPPALAEARRWACWRISSSRSSDPAEKERAWQRYHMIRRFVESARLPPPADLLAFRRDPEVEIVRRVRCVRSDASLAGRAGASPKAKTSRCSSGGELQWHPQNRSFAQNGQPNTRRRPRSAGISSRVAANNSQRAGHRRLHHHA